MHPKNFFIYCTSPLLKRRINKVYHYRANQRPYVYDSSGDHIPLEQLGADYMLLKHFNEAKISSVHNRQNSKTWWYKKRKKGIKFLKNVVA
ncbi:hypothetical protein HOV06_gp150 [Salmonella phage 1-23]|uniref:Uncharacterized protein n=1 Tax=Salmonella phage 1-23 TaxID=2508061 RepID=A0A411AVN0_9CAUD|nr:hypothetical protein HOV06_gp150 [Salmonella phage 1-23]QAX92157.1 hypothetical protein [Salmonella phage 1-23]